MDIGWILVVQWTAMDIGWILVVQWTAMDIGWICIRAGEVTLTDCFSPLTSLLSLAITFRIRETHHPKKTKKL